MFNIELTNLNSALKSKSFKLIKSNHPNRLEIYIYNFKNLNIFTNNFKWLFNNKKKNMNFHYIKKKNENLNVIFFGDSHVEFLSRIINTEKQLLPLNHYAYWLGPKTVIGFLSDDNLKSIYNEFKINLSNIKKKNYIALSFGGIDVRCVFYEILFRKIVKDEKELFKLFDKGLDLLFRNLILKLKNSKNVVGIGILGLVNSSFKGAEPKILNNLIKQKNNKLFPTFGSTDKRLFWTKKVNILIEKKAKKYNVDFIGKNSLLKIKNPNIVLTDGIHISSRNFIYKLNLEILKNAKKI